MTALLQIFPADCVSETIVKISQYLLKIRIGVWSHLFFDSLCVNKKIIFHTMLVKSGEAEGPGSFASPTAASGC